jgi:4-hydroxybenzoate polyprenyltransferase
MVLLTMVLTKYAIVNSFTSVVSDFQFILVALSILCITASGYIINDIFDVEADKINKPTKVFIDKTISKKNALSTYYVLTILGIVFGIYTSYIKGEVSYSIFFISAIFLLYWYSKSLKRIAFIGNLVVSFLITLTLFIVFVFEMKSTSSSSNIVETIVNFFASISTFITVFIYIIFAFLMTLIREMIKDIEDMKGDYALKMKTLPILIGMNRTKNIVLTLSSFVFLFLLFILKEELTPFQLFFWYTIFFIIIPFAWFLYKLYSSKTSKDFHLLSNIIKFIMFFGILSMLLIKF